MTLHWFGYYVFGSDLFEWLRTEFAGRRAGVLVHEASLGVTGAFAGGAGKTR